MFKKQQTLLYKLSAIIFILLLLTPCTIKADIKVSLNIATTTVNKDRVSINTCSSFSRNDRTVSQAIETNVVAEKDSIKLLGRDSPILPCVKTLTLECKTVGEDVNYYGAPIFIHFRELII